MGKTAVCGTESIEIDMVAHTMKMPDGTELGEGDVISIDGTTGEVSPDRWMSARHRSLSTSTPASTPPSTARISRPPELVHAVDRIMRHADEHRRLAVRANADTLTTPRAVGAWAARALACAARNTCSSATASSTSKPHPRRQRRGAGGRTGSSCCPAAQGLHPDPRGHGRAAGDDPADRPAPARVPARPHRTVRSGGRGRGAKPNEADLRLLRAVRRLHESNLMLGLRGVRLGLVVLGCSRCRARHRGGRVLPPASRRRPRAEIMIPLVVRSTNWNWSPMRPGSPRGRGEQARVHPALPDRHNDRTARAALTAGDIAKSAEFFFGTNDLTQTTWASAATMSRPVSSRCTWTRAWPGVSPFREHRRRRRGTVGQIAVDEGRRVRPDMHLGVR